jgi:hypothetical protein
METTMERRKKTTPPRLSYPDIALYLRRYGRRVGVGIVVGATATGCIWPWHVSGDMAAPPDTSDTYIDDTSSIPGDIGETGEIFRADLPETGSRNLTFEEPIWGWIDYQVQLTVSDMALYTWLVENPEAALAAVDAALGQHPVTDFEGYTGNEQVERQIAQALADAMTGAEGADTSAFVDVTLVIFNYTDENDIDGDVG